MKPITRAAVLTVAALAVTAGASLAVAAPKPLVNLQGADVGTYVLDPAGTAHLNGSVTGEPFDGAYVATLTADDGKHSRARIVRACHRDARSDLPEAQHASRRRRRGVRRVPGRHLRRDPPVVGRYASSPTPPAASCAEPTAGSR